jgi:SAM-dependent MidA family methyltransferase
LWQLLGTEPLTVVEQGAGEGHLAMDILDALRATSPEAYAKAHYRIVEVSADNRARQEQMLAGHPGRIEWCSLDDLAGMVGVVLSNELVDAFPVHLVEKREGKLLEVFVVNRGAGFAEELRPLSDPAIAAHFREIGATLVEGNRGEVGLEASRWMRRLAGLLARGFVLTIDYGYPAEELYAPFRRNGTLMCYHRHRSGENPYLRVGFQDITAHVDFTALQQAGTASGLSTLYFNQQYRFLLGLGFVEELMALQAEVADPNRARALRLTLKNLILPDGGMGETFKVLIQGKGVGQPELLCARALRDIPLPRD